MMANQLRLWFALMGIFCSNICAALLCRDRRGERRLRHLTPQVVQDALLPSGSATSNSPWRRLSLMSALTAATDNGLIPPHVLMTFIGARRSLSHSRIHSYSV
jgi:hypothetical protein